MTTRGQNAKRALVVGMPPTRQRWVEQLHQQQWWVTEQDDWLDTLPHASYYLVLLCLEVVDDGTPNTIERLKAHFPYSYFCAILCPEQLSQLPDLFQAGLDDYILSTAPAEEQWGRIQRLTHRLPLDENLYEAIAQQPFPPKPLQAATGAIAFKQFPYLASHHLRQTLIQVRRQLVTLQEQGTTPFHAHTIAQIIERTQTIQQMLSLVLGDPAALLRSPSLNHPIAHQDYIIINAQFLVHQYSDGIQQYAEAEHPVTLGQDIRDSFPELLGIEDIVSELLTGQTKGYELSGIARRSAENYPIYFDLYLNAYGSTTSYPKSAYLIILINNATERMLFQQQLIQSANEAQLLLKKLETTRDYIAQIINSMADALIVTTQSGLIKKTNPAAQNLFGYQDYEMLAQPITNFVTDQQFWAKFAQGDLTDQAEVVCQRRNQDICYVSLSCGVIVTEEDTQEFVYVCRDITERKQAEAQIQQLNQSLQERTQELEVVNEELESFSRTVSHDLRTPLSHIDFFQEALVEEFGDQLPPEALDYLGQIQQAGQRMQQLIHDLLQLSRATRAELTYETIDLGAIATEVTQQLASNAPDRTCQFVIPPSLPAFGNGALLRIVLENLLSNAWKYTSKKPQAHIEVGICPHLPSAMDRQHDGPIFFVRDNGVGFDMSYADKLFKTFSRLHSAREFEGTGVGLTTVQRIVQRHGGEIWADAAVGKGATFYFTLGSGAIALSP